VHREGWDLITKNESEFQAWLKGLKALTGNASELSEAEAVLKHLTEIEFDLRQYQIEIKDTYLHVRPPAPPPPASFQFCAGDVAADDVTGREHWRCCFADVGAEDCFNFGAVPPVFTSG